MLFRSSFSSVSSTVFAARAPVDREQYRAGPARPARAYTRGLYCFQPKGSPTAWISGDAKASHYVPGQSQRWRPCQRPSQRVAFSLIGGPLTAPAGAVRGIRFCFPPTSWRALLDARLFRWFPVLLIFVFQRTQPFGYISIVEGTLRLF